MRKITQLGIFISAIFFSMNVLAFNSINTTTAWWNAETFDSYTAGTDFKASGSLPWSGWTSSYYVLSATPTAYTYGSASGNVMSFNISNLSTFTEATTSGNRTYSKVFSNTLSNYVYGKTSLYTSTYGTTYTLQNSSGTTVFEFGGINNNANASLWCTGTTSASVALGNRAKWSDIEFLLDLSTAKVVAVKFTYNGTSKTFTGLSLASGANSSITNMLVTEIKGAGIAGLDNTTIGQLTPDSISALSGNASVQCMESTVTTDYSITSLTHVMGQDITFNKTDMDVNWTILDWGTLSTADKAKISLNRKSGDFQSATLSVGDISTDGTIVIKASYGATSLTKTVSLKALTIEGLKSTLLTEITTANGALSSVTDSNPYITTNKNTLQSVITTATTVYDNTGATLTDVSSAINTLKAAESDFSSALVPYNAFVNYISTVQTAYNAETRTSTFITTIKNTLNNSLSAANTARTTISTSTDISDAKTSLQSAYNQFTTDLPAYSALETQISTVTVKLTAVTPRMGDTRFLMFPTSNVSTLSAAKDAATIVLNTGTTATDLNAAKTTLANALSAFNAAPRVSAGTDKYKIYTYGVNDGDGGTSKMILFADANDSVKYAATDYSGLINTEWTINETSTGIYNIINVATGKYFNGNLVSSTAMDFTFPEGTSSAGLINAASDTYFLYYIVNASGKALEVDSWWNTLSNGKFVISSTAANRFRFCYQFEVSSSITDKEDAFQRRINLATTDSKIIISGMQAGEHYLVYNMIGNIIYKSIAKTNTEEIEIANGAYIVKVGNSAFKVIK